MEISGDYTDYTARRYSYMVDLMERGMFDAHVENEEGATVFFFDNTIEEEDENGAVQLFLGNPWLVEAGYMRTLDDVKGLADYLRMIGVMMPRDSLTMESAGACGSGGIGPRRLTA